MTTPDDGAAIARAFLDRLEAAIAARDLATLDGMCADDPVLFGSAAANFGLDDTRRYLRLVAEANTVRWHLDQVATLRHDADQLLVAGSGQVETDDGTGAERFDFRLTLWLVRQDDQWRLGHFHGSLPAT